jgi:hypothetical protein
MKFRKLIAKCISSMPSVFLLSELHPYTDLAIDRNQARYSPSDIISLTKYANIPNQKELHLKIFRNAVNEVYGHLNKYGGVLVLREHSHADYFTETSLPERSQVIQSLEDDYDVKYVSTIRHPLDSYASLVRNGWVHFSPPTFEEYCRRYLLSFKNCDSEQIVKYEDIVEQPKRYMKRISTLLEIPYSDLFEDIFDIFKVTGDSGRRSDVIVNRERVVPESILKESTTSSSYRDICKLFNY